MRPVENPRPTTESPAHERRARSGRVVWLMPDTGVFPLWAGGGALTPDAARNLLGLSEGLVADIWTWGQEEDSPTPAGGWDSWLACGIALHVRLQTELGIDWDVEFKPECES